MFIFGRWVFGKEEKIRADMVVAFSGALDAKDEYTAGHSHRVMEYSVSIAKQLKMREKDLEHLKTAALLHDIGKIGISDAILHKRYKLSDDEYAIIKTHPEIGCSIIGSINSFKNIVPSVYHHHERFDGKGYPAGLKGEEIPLNSRIIAIADTFDAMTSNRSYREAQSLEKALSELERSKETQLDPYITEIFIEILKSQNCPFSFEQNAEIEWYI